MNRREFLRNGGTCAGMGLIALSLAGQSKARAAGSAKRVKIGQIGTGHAHAAGKMATLRKLSEDYEVVGIVEPDPEQQRKLKDRSAYRGLKWLTEEQLLNSPGLQAVAVETDVSELVPAGMRCVSAGVHIHLDKPAGVTLAEFATLLGQATRRRLTVQMGYMFRYNPAFEFCFEAAGKGWLGDVFEVHGVISKTIGAQQRRELAAYPGSMFELGCHLIDAMVKVLGKPDKVTSYSRRTRPEQDNLADNQLAVFEYPECTATIRSALVEVAGQQRRQFVVCGDKGTVEIRPLEPPRLLLALDAPRQKYEKGYQQVNLPSIPGRYDNQLIDFARIIRGQKESEYPPEHDLAVHEAVLKASGVPLD
ncbi:MAG: Gfo/Idh/MocA family oxidoreductase [Phycisphaerales bacterium]|nr:MAG: Gfo/Idh/MocA family oxidoreductase [Phycisphaerales bacterium]